MAVIIIAYIFIAQTQTNARLTFIFKYYRAILQFLHTVFEEPRVDCELCKGKKTRIVLRSAIKPDSNKTSRGGKIIVRVIFTYKIIINNNNSNKKALKEVSRTSSLCLLLCSFPWSPSIIENSKNWINAIHKTSQNVIVLDNVRLTRLDVFFDSDGLEIPKLGHVSKRPWTISTLASHSTDLPSKHYVRSQCHSN